MFLITKIRDCLFKCEDIGDILGCTIPSVRLQCWDSVYCNHIGVIIDTRDSVSTMGRATGCEPFIYDVQPMPVDNNFGFRSHAPAKDLCIGGTIPLGTNHRVLGLVPRIAYNPGLPQDLYDTLHTIELAGVRWIEIEDEPLLTLH